MSAWRAWAAAHPKLAADVADRITEAILAHIQGEPPTDGVDLVEVTEERPGCFRAEGRLLVGDEEYGFIACPTDGGILSWGPAEDMAARAIARMEEEERLEAAGSRSRAPRRRPRAVSERTHVRRLADQVTAWHEDGALRRLGVVHGRALVAKMRRCQTHAEAKDLLDQELAYGRALQEFIRERRAGRECVMPTRPAHWQADAETDARVLAEAIDLSRELEGRR